LLFWWRTPQRLLLQTVFSIMSLSPLASLRNFSPIEDLISSWKGCSNFWPTAT
jgi:hypothetical protein